MAKKYCLRENMKRKYKEEVQRKQNSGLVEAYCSLSMLERADRIESAFAVC